MMWVEVSKKVPCIFCGRDSSKHSISRKVVITLKGKRGLVASKHYCPTCHKYFTNPAAVGHAPKRRNVSWDFLVEALLLSREHTLEESCRLLKKQTGYSLSTTTLHEWVSNEEELRKEMPESVLASMEMGKEM